MEKAITFSYAHKISRWSVRHLRSHALLISLSLEKATLHHRNHCLRHGFVALCSFRDRCILIRNHRQLVNSLGDRARMRRAMIAWKQCSLPISPCECVHTHISLSLSFSNARRTVVRLQYAKRISLYDASVFADRQRMKRAWNCIGVCCY